MNTLKMFRLMALCTMVFWFAIVESQTAEAAFGDGVVLKAQLQGKFSGEAMYTERGKQFGFYAAVKGAPANVKLNVAIRCPTGTVVHQKIAIMEADNNGYASVKMKSEIKMHQKDMIEIWLGNDLVASGYLTR